jgi:PKD repeat protein
MRTRPGYFKSNTTALTGAITGLYDYKKRTGRFLLSADDQYIRKENILYPNFVAWPQTGTAPLTVYFMDITVDDDSEITSYLWDFGDGQESTDQHPTNVYAATGLYTVTMTIFCGTKSFIKTRTNYIQVGEVENPDNPPEYPPDYPPTQPSFPYPTVTSITPSSVSVGYSATAVTVGGTNFRQSPSAILIGNTKATGLGFTSATALTGTVPAGLVGGAYDVIVSNPDGKTGAIVDGFTVIAPSGTFVDEHSPDDNNSTSIFWWVQNTRLDGLGKTRIFIKDAPNKTYHIYKHHYFGYQKEITVSEVDPADFDVATVTWNNQPTLGDTITTFTPTHLDSWYTFSTGTTGAFCLKLTDESQADATGDFFYSYLWTDPTYRPYVT